LRFFGFKYYCALCGRRTRRFTPIKYYPGQETIDLYQIIAMGVNPHFRCPWCNSSDKERLVWSYLKFHTDFLTTNRSFSVLHVAPERNTRNYFKSRSNVSYIAGDKFEGAEKYTAEHYGGARYLDITNLHDFADGTFDLIICNHVLEHVLEDKKAMRELFRVLKPGGQAIVQVPISKKISISIEDPHADTTEKRIKAFGQGDHVRIYAEQDYLSRLQGAGFLLSVYPADRLLSLVQVREWGVNPKESVYVAFKQPSRFHPAGGS
jgi:hypothetical protein